MPGRIQFVFLDVGGVLYGDSGYRNALARALRDLGASFTDEEFRAAYDECRREQEGSFRIKLTRRFLGDGVPIEEVEREAARWWHYDAGELEPDALPCLQQLAPRYRLGLLANQPSAVREAMRRDGLEPFFEVWGISDDVGLEKPDPRLFSHVLYEAGVAPPRAAMVGDRLDYDIRPARRAGMKAVWMLRGEAPDDPSPEQLAEADAAIHGLDELPAVLERL